MKAIHIILLLVCLCVPTWAEPAASAITLEGSVTDSADGEPLIGVSIYFPELREGTVSDEHGHYVISGLPPIQTTIQVSYVGHQTIIRTVDLRTVRHLDFTMKEANATLSEVVVTGLTGTELLSNSPSPVSIVTPHTLQHTAATNIIDALAKQPGVSQITTGSGISKPVIRGLGYNRILVVNDGIRQEGQQWGDEHGIEIDAQRVHTVEILKGPASLVYGSDAMAGVLIFHDDPVMPKGTMQANIASEYQTNNGLFDYTADFAGNKGGLVWNWRWSQKMAHDYKNKYDGRVTNSRFSERALSGLLGLNRDWGFSHLKLSYYHLTPGIVEGERDPQTGILERSGKPLSYGKLMPYQQIQHYKAVLDNSILIGNGALKLLVGYQHNRRKEFEEHHHEEHHDNEQEEHEDEHHEEHEDEHHEEHEAHEHHAGVGLDFMLHTINYDLHYQSGESHGWKSAFGVAGMYQKSENQGEEFLIPAYNLFDVGVFATTCRTVGRWHLSGGLRYDSRHLHSHQLYTEEDGERFSTFSRDFNALTGSLGAICNINDHTNFRVNASRGFRAPNLSELGSNGAHHGALRYEVGNQLLRPEYSWQTDIGLDFSSAIVSAQVALFVNFISNYIFAERTHEKLPLSSSSEQLPVFRYTQGTARIMGGEFSVDFHPIEPLHFENTFSYVNSRKLNSDSEAKWLPYTPAPRWLSTLRYDIIRDGRTLNNTYVAIEVDCNLRQNHYYAAYDTETATPAYTLLNIAAGTDLRHRGRKVASLFVFANNVFDKAYQSHLSRLKYAPINSVTGRQGVYNMGRNLGIKVQVPIQL